ncbi:MAG TPA: RNA-binding S4 domain-containing protein [Gemmatimonadales bacterium]|jgi:ribosome-associated heat shock protein Hsp15|nr:RNA-binding S4 domain-containing protein [Gemmatimonadales bacterium]
MTDRDDRVRIDKWLWAARFYKTRSLATEAVTGGKVEVNGERAKPARAVRVGDQVVVRQPPFEWQLTVRGLAERRGPASVAQGLYEETPESRMERERRAAGLRVTQPLFVYEEKGRPTKKDRRMIDRWERER